MEKQSVEYYIRMCWLRSAPDWEHAPLPFKFYRDCPRLSLTSETLEALASEQETNHRFSPGLFLHDIYGITRIVYHEVVDLDMLDTQKRAEANLSLRRTVGSGGALFPGELYLLVNSGQEIAPGLYHYDSAHHALDLLSTDHWPHAFLDTLAQPPEAEPGYLFLFSSLFWKNAFKYQEFSYRLHGLDIGCLLAQAQIVTEHYGLKPTFHFQFLDHELNQLLGLHSLEESVYAVITLSGNAPRTTSAHIPQNELHALTVDKPPQSLECYERLSRWPLLEAIHRRSCIETREDLYRIPTMPPLTIPSSASDDVIELPFVPYVHSRIYLQRRRSAHLLQFRPLPLTLSQLALLLQTGQREFEGDINKEAADFSHIMIYCVVNHVEGVVPGIYVYQPEQHLLRLVSVGQFHRPLQATLSEQELNVDNLSLCVVLVGNYARGLSTYGERWYRIQNMEAGMIVQRLYLAAAMNELGCRANLAYNETLVNTLLDLPADYTSLIQLFISPIETARRDSGWFEQPIIW